MAYKDPYRPTGWPGYKMYNRIYSFISFRNIENEFIDFEHYTADTQYRELYEDLGNAYRRSDKVILSRSLSSSMLKYIQDQLKEGRPNPFYKDVNSLKMVQARVYANQDNLLPEDQWA